MFTTSGSYKSKMLERLAPDKVKDALQGTLDHRARVLAAEVTKDFQRGVERAGELVEQQAKEDEEAVPEVTLKMLEAGKEIEFIGEQDSSSLTVAGEAEAKVSVREEETPAGPAPLVARTFEYGSAAKHIPTVPTFRSTIQREVNRAGKTLREARDKL